MKNLDIYLTPDGRVSMSLDTYVEIRMSLIPHGETDLPEYPDRQLLEDSSTIVADPVRVPFDPAYFEVEDSE